MFRVERSGNDSSERLEGRYRYQSDPEKVSSSMKREQLIFALDLGMSGNAFSQT